MTRKSGMTSPARSLARRRSGRTIWRKAASQEVRGKGASEMVSANGWDAGRLEIKMSHYGHI